MDIGTLELKMGKSEKKGYGYHNKKAVLKSQMSTILNGQWGWDESFWDSSWGNAQGYFQATGEFGVVDLTKEGMVVDLSKLKVFRLNAEAEYERNFRTWEQNIEGSEI